MSRNNTKPCLVDAKSVPSCLRHDSKAGILEDAQNLAAFLEEAVSIRSPLTPNLPSSSVWACRLRSAFFRTSCGLLAESYPDR